MLTVTQRSLPFHLAPFIANVELIQLHLIPPRSGLC